VHPSNSREDANFALERFAASFASADVLLLAALLVVPKYGALVSALGGGLLACGGGDEPALEAHAELGGGAAALALSFGCRAALAWVEARARPRVTAVWR